MVTAQDVKKLRDMTGAGMMDCKTALQEADGDFDDAIDILRKKGREVSENRAGREANEGLVVTKISDDGKQATIAEINCETDFVARNDEFQEFAQNVTEFIHAEQPDDVDEVLESTLEDDLTVEQTVAELTGKIGEKIVVRRFDQLHTDDGTLVSYVHPGSKLGVLVEVAGSGDREQVGRDVAMQVAAMNPIALRREDVPEEVAEREKKIARDQAEEAGKPDHVMDQIVSGKLDKFFSERVLLEQDFVKDSATTVQEMLEDNDVELRRYIRYSLGD